MNNCAPEDAVFSAQLHIIQIDDHVRIRGTAADGVVEMYLYTHTLSMANTQTCMCLLRTRCSVIESGRTKHTASTTQASEH